MYSEPGQSSDLFIILNISDILTHNPSPDGPATNPDIRLGETRVIKIALSVLSTSKLDQIHDLKLN